MDTFETKTFGQSLLQQLRYTQNVATHAIRYVHTKIRTYYWIADLSTTH